jgi:hypothetical protein
MNLKQNSCSDEAQDLNLKGHNTMQKYRDDKNGQYILNSYCTHQAPYYYGM